MMRVATASVNPVAMKHASPVNKIVAAKMAKSVSKNSVRFHPNLPPAQTEQTPNPKAATAALSDLLSVQKMHHNPINRKTTHPKPTSTPS